jgi:hypothetical protein
MKTRCITCYFKDIFKKITFGKRTCSYNYNAVFRDLGDFGIYDFDQGIIPDGFGNLSGKLISVHSQRSAGRNTSPVS